MRVKTLLEMERDWKCVSLAGQRLASYDPCDLDEFNLCVHVKTLPCCCLTNRPIMQSVVVNDGVVYQKSALDRQYAHQDIGKSRVTRLDFLPHRQYWLRFSCGGPQYSKLDSDKTFSHDYPIIGIFRGKIADDREDERKIILMVEKKDDHGCGCLMVYSVVQEKIEKLTHLFIKEQSFLHLDYAMLDKKLLLGAYCRDEQHQSLVINVTTEIVSQLEQAVYQQSRALVAGNICYNEKPENVASDLFSFFFYAVCRIEPHNVNSLFISLLSHSGMITQRLSLSLNHRVFSLFELREKSQGRGLMAPDEEDENTETPTHDFSFS